MERPNRRIEQLRRRDTPWPAGGVFVPRALAEGDAEALNSRTSVVIDDDRARLSLLEDVANVKPSDVESLREFTETWGMLGTSSGTAPVLLESVEATRAWLVAIQAVLRTAPGSAAERRVWRSLHRAAAADGTVRPGAVPKIADMYVEFSPSGPRPLLFFDCLRDVLLAALVTRPIDAGTPRECGNCGRTMLGARSGKRFCSKACGNRARVRRAKKKQRALRRLQEGKSVAAVARLYGLPAAKVREWARNAGKTAKGEDR